MILCQKCGHENADDASFCGECNAYLEWSGQRVASPPPLPGPVAAPPPGTPMAPPPRPVPAPRPDPSGSPPPAPPATSVPSPPATPVPSPPAATASPRPATAPAPTQPAARPPSAVPDAPPPRRPTPPTDQPRSRQPTTQPELARPRPDPRTAPEEPPLKAGDRICPVCGVGNDPARRFCRRCGAGLEQAVVAVPVHVPWHRRLFRRGPPERYQAGQRPRSMAERGRPRRSIVGILVPLAVVVAIVAAVTSYVAVPDIQRQVNDTVAGLKRQFLPQLADVTPTAGASAVDAIDGNLLTWWEGGGDQPGLTLRFNPAVDLGALGITAGANGDDFPTFRRPTQIRLVPEDGDPVTLDLADTRDFQSFRIDLRDVARLRVQVLESRGPGGAPVAIRELQFQEVR